MRLVNQFPIHFGLEETYLLIKRYQHSLPRTLCTQNTFPLMLDIMAKPEINHLHESLQYPLVISINSRH